MNAVEEVLDKLELKVGVHKSFEQGACLLEVARERMRYRADGLAARGLPLWVRLFGRAELTASGCWEIGGHHNDDGYGSVRDSTGLQQKAHRVAYEVASGKAIPAGTVVMHSCDNPPCINPSHLSVGTVTDNNRDRETKGRTRGLVLGAGAEFQRSKTHCPEGHSYDGDNVRYRPDGRRRCAECYRLRDLSYKAEHRDEINARRRERRANGKAN